MTSVSKIFLLLLFLWISTVNLFAQDSFAEQFNLAKKLYDEENYFDAVTEFKRLLFFDDSELYSLESNFLIGLSYKNGAKFSEAIQFFTISELNSRTPEEVFESRLEIIKVNILRRTTERAFTLLNSLQNDSRFISKLDEINYWRGWAYIFSDDWENASLSFSTIQANHHLAVLCDSLDKDFYSVQLAKYLSIVPGAGQFYTGEYVSGIISIGWNVLWGYLTINAFMEDRILDGLLIGSLLWWRFYSGNIQNAERFAIEKNLEKTNSALRYLQNDYKGSKP
jgi:TM2 domain-containing membrane protein YozV